MPGHKAQELEPGTLPPDVVEFIKSHVCEFWRQMLKFGEFNLEKLVLLKVISDENMRKFLHGGKFENDSEEKILRRDTNETKEFLKKHAALIDKKEIS